MRDAHERVLEFVERDLKLKIKSEVTVHAPVSEGVPFLGLRIWPRLIRLDGPNKRRLIRSLRIGAAAVKGERLTEDDLADSLRSRLGHAEHADTLRLRQSLGNLMDLGSGALQARTGSSGAHPISSGNI